MANGACLPVALCLLPVLVVTSPTAQADTHHLYRASQAATPAATGITVPTVAVPETTPVSVPTVTIPQPTPTSTPRPTPRPHPKKPHPKPSRPRRPAPVRTQLWVWAYLTSYCPDSAGWLSASGMPVFYGMLANDYYRFGTRVYLPVLGITGVVEDRIGTFGLWNHFDVWSPICYATPTGWFRVAVQTK